MTIKNEKNNISTDIKVTIKKKEKPKEEPKVVEEENKDYEIVNKDGLL